MHCSPFYKNTGKSEKINLFFTGSWSGPKERRNLRRNCLIPVDAERFFFFKFIQSKQTLFSLMEIFRHMYDLKKINCIFPCLMHSPSVLIFYIFLLTIFECQLVSSVKYHNMTTDLGITQRLSQFTSYIETHH